MTPEEREELLDGLLQIDGKFEPDATDIVEWNRRFDELEAGHVQVTDTFDAIAAARADLKSQRS